MVFHQVRLHCYHASKSAIACCRDMLTSGVWEVGVLHKTVAFQEHSHPPPRVHIHTHGVVLSALQGFKSCLSHLLACNLRLCIYCLLSVSTCQWEPELDLAHSTVVRMLGVSTGNTLSMEAPTCGSCRHIFLCYFKSAQMPLLAQC